MADHLPLIPSRNGGCEAGVRGVVRGVLRAACVLPPLQSCACGPPGPAAPGPESLEPAPPEPLPPPLPEAALQEQRAERLARPESRHPYRPRGPPPDPPPRSLPQPLLSRADLMPSIEQYATRDASLWVRNVLGRSMEDVRRVGTDSSLHSHSASPSPSRPRHHLQRFTRQTTASTLQLAAASGASCPPAATDYLVCVPDSLQFVNFTLYELHTACVRVVNLSRAEVRVAVRPPASGALHVELCGRPAVTSGAHLLLRVHFLPHTVRALHDRLLLRASHGPDLAVPIACYMQPPTLNVLVPNMTSLLSCVVPGGEGGAGGWGPAGGAPGLPGDVLDLGARLLGDMHSICLVLDSNAHHAAFFLLTEDAWQSHQLSEVSGGGALVCGGWAVWPAWFRGGGRARGTACCRAARAGLHSVTLRVLSSTAVARSLHLLADSIYYHPKHVTLQAQQKTYDICSEADEDCEYYVHLGTAFQRQQVSGTITLINHSPVTYSYYWSMRAWGKCSCWRESEGEQEAEWEEECSGARAQAARRAGADPEQSDDEQEDEGAACCVEPAYGTLPPRSERVVNISVSDVGERLGTHRLVLVLVLKNIPYESFPPGFVPSVVSTSEMRTDCIPGLGERSVRVAHVAALQLEVWWCVCRRRVLVSPRAVRLVMSRRVRAVPMPLQAVLLHPGGVARARWHVDRQPQLDALVLHTLRPVVTTLPLELPDPPDEHPVEREITLEAEDGEWREAVLVRVAAARRAMRLQPALGWLGVVPPGQPLAATLQLHNDTHQDTYWWADVRRCIGENPPRPVCVGRAPCDVCHEASCTCAMLRPTRGALARDATVDLLYGVNAPTRDGCVVSVVRARRTAADTGPRLPPARPVLARASVLAYRVLAPRLQLLVKPCKESCPCGAGCGPSDGGGALWRAERALVVGSRTCCRLLLRNMTPLPTRFVWDHYDDKNEALRVTFKPKEFNVAGFEEVEVGAVVSAMRVCGRRLWVRRALVEHAYEPLYLLLEAAIEGVELECWLPLPTAYVRVYRKQREVFPWSRRLPVTPAECFAWDLEKRIKLRLCCRCQKRLVYLEPPRRRRPKPPVIDNALYLDVVDSRPVLNWVCVCHDTCRPLPPLEEPFVLQFRKVPLRTVNSLSVRLRSRGAVAAHWSASVLLGAKPTRPTLQPEEAWARRVLEHGACAAVRPARGVLGSGAVQDIELSVYADTWGVYRNQLLIQTEHLEPMVVDVWLEVVGSPLHFRLQHPHSDAPPLMWMSRTDPSHTLRARNTSRADLLVRAYVLRDHDHPSDALPLRLYYRLLDAEPPVCPCTHAYDVESDSNLSTEMATQVELFLGPDYGYQDAHYYELSPAEQRVVAGAACEWQVRAVPPAPAAPLPAPATRSKSACASAPASRSACITYINDYSMLAVSSATTAIENDDDDDDVSVSNSIVLPDPPPHNLMLRITPVETQGEEFYRPEPLAARVRVSWANRQGELMLQQTCVRINLCALSLKPENLTRVYRVVGVKNVGEGALQVSCRVVAARGEGGGAEWTVWRRAPGPASCGDGCEPQARAQAPHKQLDIDLPPRATTELTLEVAVGTKHIWPSAAMNELKTPALGIGAGDAGAGRGCPAGRGAPDECPVTAPLVPPPAPYERLRVYNATLQFYDDYSLLQELPLTLEVEVPALRAHPLEIDFNYVCDDDSRKQYFTAWHTSKSETLCVKVEWSGDEQFMVHPPALRLRPGERANVYVQYTISSSFVTD